MIANVTFIEESHVKASYLLFRWPTKPNIQDINILKIIQVIDEPKACSKSKRQFCLRDSDYVYLDSDSD